MEGNREPALHESEEGERGYEKAGAGKLHDNDLKKLKAKETVIEQINHGISATSTKNVKMKYSPQWLWNRLREYKYRVSYIYIPQLYARS